MTSIQQVTEELEEKCWRMSQLRGRDIDEYPERRHFRTHWLVLIKVSYEFTTTSRVSVFVLYYLRRCAVVVVKWSISWSVLTWINVFSVKCWNLDKKDVSFVKRIYPASWLFDSESDYIHSTSSHFISPPYPFFWYIFFFWDTCKIHFDKVFWRPLKKTSFFRWYL